MKIKDYIIVFLVCILGTLGVAVAVGIITWIIGAGFKLGFGITILVSIGLGISVWSAQE